MSPSGPKIIDWTVEAVPPVSSPLSSEYISKSTIREAKPLRNLFGKLGGNISTKRSAVNRMTDKGFKERIAPLRKPQLQSTEDVMSQARVVRSINAPAKEVWKTLRDFNRVEKFLPAVASCTLEGTGVGARRVCTLQNGSKVFERLVTIDETERILRYSVTQSLLPFESYLGTIKVRDIGNHKCQIDWSSTFDPTGIPESQVVGMIESMYLESIEGLEKLYNVDTSR